MAEQVPQVYAAVAVETTMGRVWVAYEDGKLSAYSEDEGERVWIHREQFRDALHAVLEGAEEAPLAAGSRVVQGLRARQRRRRRPGDPERLVYYIHDCGAEAGLSLPTARALLRELNVGALSGLTDDERAAVRVLREHSAHVAHPDLPERREFLVDGCPRCREYVRDIGLHFTPDRWLAFWLHMVKIEFDGDGGYSSVYDKELGRKLYYVALGLQRATGIDPRILGLVAPLLSGIYDDLLRIIPRLTFKTIVDHLRNARMVLDEGPANLAEAERAVLGTSELPPGSPLIDYAVAQLDVVLDALRPFADEDEEPSP